MAASPETDGIGGETGRSPGNSRTGVVVLGMHRSGTSAVTAVLRCMGCDPGPDEAMMPAQPDNPKGFGERQDVYELNEELLRALGLGWSSTAGFDLDRLGPRRARPLELRAEEIAKDLADRSPWVLKDPRLCLLLPFWRRFLAEPAVVLVRRHPLAVARSLQARNDLGLDEGLALWEQHVLASLEHSADLPRVLVGYEDLLSRPEATARRLTEELSAHGVPGLDAPSSDELESALDRNLRHQVVAAEEAEEPLPPPVLELWRALADESAVLPGARLPRLSETSLRLLLDQPREPGVERLRPTPRRAASQARRAILREARLENLQTDLDRLEAELERSWVAAESARRDLWRRDHENRQTIRRLQDELSVARERNRRLEGWLAELDAALTGLLASRRWRLGSRLASLHRRALLRGAAPDPAAHLRRILTAWRASGETENPSEESR